MESSKLGVLILSIIVIFIGMSLILTNLVATVLFNIGLAIILLGMSNIILIRIHKDWIPFQPKLSSKKCDVTVLKFHSIIWSALLMKACRIPPRFLFSSDLKERSHFNNITLQLLPVFSFSCGLMNRVSTLELTSKGVFFDCELDYVWVFLALVTPCTGMLLPGVFRRFHHLSNNSDFQGHIRLIQRHYRFFDFFS